MTPVDMDFYGCCMSVMITSLISIHYSFSRAADETKIYISLMRNDRVFK